MNRRRVIGLVGLAIIVYVGTLVSAAPAARVVDWFETGRVELRGVDGRIWAGHAEALRVAGMPLELTDVAWDVSAWRLFTGELGSEVEAVAAGIEARGYVAVTGGRKLRVADMTLRGPVSGLVEQLPYPLAASGSLLARVEAGTLVDGLPRDFRGRAVWSEARIQAPMALALGEVVVDFEPDGEEQAVSIRAEGGEVEIDGNLRLQPDGAFTVEMALTPTERAGKQVRDTLTLLARPDGQGRYVIRQSGRMR